MGLFKKVLNPQFEIEHYPESKRYYVRCGGSYLRTNYYTGIVETIPYGISLAEDCKTEEDARKLITLYKEQQLKENIKIIIV